MTPARARADRLLFGTTHVADVAIILFGAFVLLVVLLPWADEPPRRDVGPLFVAPKIIGLRAEALGRAQAVEARR